MWSDFYFQGVCIRLWWRLGGGRCWGFSIPPSPLTINPCCFSATSHRKVEAIHFQEKEHRCLVTTIIVFSREGARGARALSIFQNNEKKCVFNKRTIKVSVSCSWRCLGPYHLVAYLMVSLYLCSSGSNAGGELRVLEGHRVSSKALQGSETETRKLLGGTEEKNVSSTRGHWFVTKKETENDWVSGQTW